MYIILLVNNVQSGIWHMQVGYLEHSKAEVPGFIQNLVGTVGVSKTKADWSMQKQKLCRFGGLDVDVDVDVDVYVYVYVYAYAYAYGGGGEIFSLSHAALLFHSPIKSKRVKMRCCFLVCISLHMGFLNCLFLVSPTHLNHNPHHKHIILPLLLKSLKNIFCYPFHFHAFSFSSYYFCLHSLYFFIILSFFIVFYSFFQLITFTYTFLFRFYILKHFQQFLN